MSLENNYPNFVQCTPIYLYSEITQKTIICKNCFKFPSYTITDDPNKVQIQCIDCGFTEITPIKNFLNFLKLKNKESKSLNLLIDESYSIDSEKWLIEGYKDLKQRENHSLCKIHNKTEQYFCDKCKLSFCEICWKEKVCSVEQKVHIKYIKSNDILLGEFASYIKKGKITLQHYENEKKQLINILQSCIQDIEHTFTTANQINKNMLKLLESFLPFINVKNSNVIPTLNNIINSSLWKVPHFQFKCDNDNHSEFTQFVNSFKRTRNNMNKDNYLQINKQQLSKQHKMNIFVSQTNFEHFLINEEDEKLLQSLHQPKLDIGSILKNDLFDLPSDVKLQVSSVWNSDELLQHLLDVYTNIDELSNLKLTYNIHAYLNTQQEKNPNDLLLFYLFLLKCFQTNINIDTFMKSILEQYHKDKAEQIIKHLQHLATSFKDNKFNLPQIPIPQEINKNNQHLVYYMNFKRFLETPIEQKSLKETLMHLSLPVNPSKLLQNNLLYAINKILNHLETVPKKNGLFFESIFVTSTIAPFLFGTNTVNCLIAIFKTPSLYQLTLINYSNCFTL